MTQVNVGIVPDDGTGDVLRNAFIITNANFIEIYNDLEGVASGLNSSVFILDTRMNAVEAKNLSQDSSITSINGSIMAINTLILNQNITISSMNAIIASQSAAIAELYEIIGNL